MALRKIIAVTASRSEYDLLYSLYKLLDEDENIDFSLVVTGAHLSEKFGLTIKQIISDGFTVSNKVFNLIDSDQKIGRILSLGNQISTLAHIFNDNNPDLVLVAGDREEALSVTTTGAYMNIPVAHFFGGDIAKDGNIDNSVRYAASKLAHLHFVTLQKHKQNLIKLGEDEWRIHVIGNPAIDRLISTPKVEVGAIAEFLGLKFAPKEYLVLIQHPIITQIELQDKHIRSTLNAILRSGYYCFVNSPNSDAGNQAIVDAYREYQKSYPDNFFVFKNLDRINYINLLRNAKCLIGNSSSGLLEAPSLKLPAINVGDRQRGRLAGDNVIFTTNMENDIYNAIVRATTDESFISKVKLADNPYGNGDSSYKAYKVLKDILINDDLKFKNITYS